MPDPQKPVFQVPAQLRTSDQLEAMANHQQSAIRQHMAADNKRLIEQSELTAKLLADMDLPRLPETHFMWFLQYFTGEASTDDGQNAIAKWISIASTPASEVSIIDAGGNELFRVPPLFDTSIINPVRKLDQAVGFGTIVLLAMEHGRHLPSRGNNFLVGKLNKKQQEIRTKSTVHNEYSQRWLEIFKRYGKLRAADQEVKKDNDEISDDELE